MRATSPSSSARGPWHRAVAARQAQRDSEVTGADRLTESTLRLNRSYERLNESQRRVGRGRKRPASRGGSDPSSLGPPDGLGVQARV
jgi:hypothetical protein